jgi:Protein of unknown function (DUF3775)
MLTAIDPDTVCYLIIKMRELSVKMTPQALMPGDNPVDNADREILFSYPDDPTEEEIQKTIETLNEDASTELFALVLLGRDDFADWQSALVAARENPDLRTAHALTGIPLVATYLEDGLTQLGYSCADLEGDRL